MMNSQSQSSIFKFLYTIRCKSCVFGLIFGITVTSIMALSIVLIITPYMKKAEKHAYGQQSIVCSSNVRWEPCSVTCGHGIQVGMYEADFIGDWNVTLHQPCVNKACPVTGYWSNWMEVGFCSVSCGEGTVTIVREFWNSKVQNERQTCDRKQWGLGFCIRPDCKPISEINIALAKDTHQSSTYAPTKRFYSKLAVDGKIETKSIGSGPKCTHTIGVSQDWWAVDLGDIYQITNVVIYGRTDCCPDRLSNFDIDAIMPVLFQDSNWATFQEGHTTLVYHRQDVLPPTHVLQAYCNNRKAIGKYLRVRLRGKKIPLTLCEVQVYGRFVREFRTVQTVINSGMEIIKPKPYDGQWLEAAKRNDSQSCTDLCKTKSKCEIYNFNEATQECVMSIKGTTSNACP